MTQDEINRKTSWIIEEAALEGKCTYIPVELHLAIESRLLSLSDDVYVEQNIRYYSGKWDDGKGFLEWSVGVEL